MKVNATNDEILEEIVRIMESSNEPLETEELVSRVRSKYEQSSRTKVLYRLNNLRGERKILGKMVGAGKGVWIWWKPIPIMTVKK